MSAQTIALIRGLIVVVAVLFSQGVIPTGIDGGGQKVSDALMVVAVTLAAGQKNEPEQK